jgi:hypothetical protein
MPAAIFMAAAYVQLVEPFHGVAAKAAKLNHRPIRDPGLVAWQNENRPTRHDSDARADQALA